MNPFNQPIVEYLQLLYNDLSSLGIRAPYAALGAMGAVLLLFVLQLRYYLHVYGRLPRFRNNRGVGSQVATPPISVVIVVRENSFYFIEQILPKLLRQQYDAFEVILVDCSYNEEISELLALQRLEHPNLHVTAFKQQLPSAHSTKLALTVGIKAARYEHILFTTPDAVPDSDRWIALMAKGFICGDVVLGYCGIELKKNWSNRWIRCSRLALSMRYLA
ncbi:MAG: hypothetical protein PHV49_04125, partial [Alistipes sp.]|nr:hypothetical protein [Alistipes sp.]